MKGNHKQSSLVVTPFWLRKESKSGFDFARRLIPSWLRKARERERERERISLIIFDRKLLLLLTNSIWMYRINVGARRIVVEIDTRWNLSSSLFLTLCIYVYKIHSEIWWRTRDFTCDLNRSRLLQPSSLGSSYGDKFTRRRIFDVKVNTNFQSISRQHYHVICLKLFLKSFGLEQVKLKKLFI